MVLRITLAGFKGKIYGQGGEKRNRGEREKEKRGKGRQHPEINFCMDLLFNHREPDSDRPKFG